MAVSITFPPTVQEHSLFSAAAAAAAKSLQLCPTLCDPIDSSPPGSPVPGILQVRALEWVMPTLSANNPPFQKYTKNEGGIEPVTYKDAPSNFIHVIK